MEVMAGAYVEGCVRTAGFSLAYSLATTLGGWQQVEHPDGPAFETWVIDPRAPKGFFQGSDGQWTHHWVPLPEFILNAAASGLQATPEVASPKDASLRVSRSCVLY